MKIRFCVPRGRNSSVNVHDPCVSTCSALSRSGVPCWRTTRFTPSASTAGPRWFAISARASPRSAGCGDERKNVRSRRLFATRNTASSAAATACAGWRVRGLGMSANSSTSLRSVAGRGPVWAGSSMEVEEPAETSTASPIRRCGARAKPRAVGGHPGRSAEAGVSIREIRDMTRPMSGTFARVITAVAVVGAIGCTKARTPEEGYRRFCKAVIARDAPALFEALDQKRRWAWMTVQKSHREAYDSILSNYPEGPERDREVHRFERGATLGSGRADFVDEVGQGALGGLRPLCAGSDRFELGSDGTTATAVLASGAKVPLRIGPEDKSR